MRMIFVGGLHRSGTTMLWRWLMDQPTVTGIRGSGAPEEEGQWLQTVYRTASDFGGPGEFALDARSHLTELDVVNADAERQSLMTSWLKYGDASKKVFVEKSPPNLIRSRYLQAVFPQSSYVFVLRHPFAIAMATRKWSRVSFTAAVGNVVVAYETMLADTKHLGAAHMTVHYEDLCAPNSSIFGSLGASLGLDIRPPKGVRSGVNTQYQQQFMEYAGVRAGIKKGGDRVAKGGNKLLGWSNYFVGSKSAEYFAAKSLYRARIKTFGYDVDDWNSFNDIGVFPED